MVVEFPTSILYETMLAILINVGFNEAALCCSQELERQSKCC